MRNLNILFLLLVIIPACRQREMTLEDLKKAKWNNLKPGVDFISIENESGIGSKTDSIEFRLIGIVEKSLKDVTYPSYKISEETKTLLKDILRSGVPDSRYGYLRTNVYEKPIKKLALTVYLSDDYKPSGDRSFSKDSIKLKSKPGIRDLKYISKKEAGTSNKSSIEITLDNREWSTIAQNDLKNSILDQLAPASEIMFESVEIQGRELNNFYQYKRIKTGKQ